jgi:hypothetical protein
MRQEGWQRQIERKRSANNIGRSTEAQIFLVEDFPGFCAELAKEFSYFFLQMGPRALLWQNLILIFLYHRHRSSRQK